MATNIKALRIVCLSALCCFGLLSSSLPASAQGTSAQAAAETAASADELIGTFKKGVLVMYFNPGCQYCQKAKAWLELQGHPYELRDVRVESYKKEHMLLGGRGVPHAVLDGQIIRGFTPEIYEAAYKK